MTSSMSLGPTTAAGDKCNVNRLRIDPTVELQFSLSPFEEEPQTTITLSHPGDHHESFAFKIKMHHPSRYRVDTILGMIGPNGSKQLEISMVNSVKTFILQKYQLMGQTALDRAKSQFMVQSCLVHSNIVNEYNHADEDAQDRLLLSLFATLTSSAAASSGSKITTNTPNATPVANQILQVRHTVSIACSSPTQLLSSSTPPIGNMTKQQMALELTHWRRKYEEPVVLTAERDKTSKRTKRDSSRNRTKTERENKRHRLEEEKSSKQSDDGEQSFSEPTKICEKKSKRHNVNRWSDQERSALYKKCAGAYQNGYWLTQAVPTRNLRQINDHWRYYCSKFKTEQEAMAAAAIEAAAIEAKFANHAATSKLGFDDDIVDKTAGKHIPIHKPDASVINNIPTTEVTSKEAKSDFQVSYNKPGRWSDNEILLFLKIYAAPGRNENLLAQGVPTRNLRQITDRWRSYRSKFGTEQEAMEAAAIEAKAIEAKFANKAAIKTAFDAVHSAKAHLNAICREEHCISWTGQERNSVLRRKLGVLDPSSGPLIDSLLRDCEENLRGSFVELPLNLLKILANGFLDSIQSQKFQGSGNLKSRGFDYAGLGGLKNICSDWERIQNLLESRVHKALSDLGCCNEKQNVELHLWFLLTLWSHPQRSHVAYKWKDALPQTSNDYIYQNGSFNEDFDEDYQSEDYRLRVPFIAVFPLTKQGMCLEVWPHQDHRFADTIIEQRTQGRLVFVPFGNMLILRADTVHAGGFLSHQSGQPQVHLYIHKLNKNREERKFRGTPYPNHLSDIYFVSDDRQELLDDVYIHFDDTD